MIFGRKVSHEKKLFTAPSSTLSLSFSCCFIWPSMMRPRYNIKIIRVSIYKWLIKLKLFFLCFYNFFRFSSLLCAKNDRGENFRLRFLFSLRVFRASLRHLKISCKLITFFLLIHNDFIVRKIELQQIKTSEKPKNVIFSMCMLWKSWCDPRLLFLFSRLNVETFFWINER